MRIIKANGTDEIKFINSLTEREEAGDNSIENIVGNILSDVRKNGDTALFSYENKFGNDINKDTVELTREDLKKAYENIDEDLRKALIAASSNIKKYHENQKTESYEIKDKNGCILGQTVRGLDKVGVYVPGGTAPYPSSVLMNVIPAKIAGVNEIIMVTPRRDENVMAAAFIAGADRSFMIGGAQGVAALAYGTETIPKVDKIVGPGNAYVTEAKKQLYGQVDIDMIAGPSEVLVMADENGNPEYIAADLLSQAEHDVMAASVLLTTDEEVAEKTAKEVTKQLDLLERKEIASASIENNGAVIICRSEDEMIKYANLIAPEHLEITMADPLGYVPRINNAGSIFLGEYSPEPLGDYYAGTNHVLPTSGTARFASPLGVYDFVKKMSYTFYTKEALKEAKDDIMKIGEAEGLTAHVNSVKIRFK